MKHQLSIAALSIAVVIPGLCDCQETEGEPQLDEILISDPNWGYPAVFTQAPRNLVIRMRDAIESVCNRLVLEATEEYIIPPGADPRYYVDVPGSTYWLCESRNQYFYRGIDGWGKESNSGFVCEYRLGLPGQKYIGDSRFAGCVFLWWNDEIRHHEVVLDEEE
jgi:hypothetical protein